MKENFINYDLAVKLKDKGFREHVRGHYKSKCHLSICSEPINCNGSASGDISAPQIHEVLKWLREKKNLHVAIELSDRNTYCWCIQFVDRRISRISSHFNNYFDNWEETALGAIRYALFNLI